MIDFFWALLFCYFQTVLVCVHFRQIDNALIKYAQKYKFKCLYIIQEKHNYFARQRFYLFLFLSWVGPIRV